MAASGAIFIIPCKRSLLISMRALVVNPWITDFKLYDEWMHPLGLYAVISFLVQNGWEVDYIDLLGRDPESKTKRYNTGAFPSIHIPAPSPLNTIPRKYKRYGVSDEKCARQLRYLPRPDVVFIGSGMTYWIDGLRITVAKIRESLPDTPIVIGGIAASLVPEAVCRSLRGFRGVSVIGGPLTEAAKRLTLFGNDRIGHWRFSLLDLRGIVTTPFHAPVLATLGCPLRCSYCASRKLQPSFQIRDPETIFREIRFFASQRGIGDFSFYDDALLFRAEQTIIPLAKKLGISGLRLRFHTPNGLHLRYVTEAVAHALAETGFRTLRFGYESGNRRFKHDTNGKSERALVAQKVGHLFKHGFCRKDIGIYVMAGLPGQKHDEVIEEVEFIGSLGVQAKPVFLSPVPFTGLYEQYKVRFPEIAINPLLHNDIYFVTIMDGWSWEQAEEVREAARRVNTR